MFLIQSTIFTVFLGSLAVSVDPDVELQLLHVVKPYNLISIFQRRVKSACALTVMRIVSKPFSSKI